MARIKLRDEMVEVDEGSGGYYKVDILLLPDNSNEGQAYIPGMGRVLVYKKMPQYEYQGVSFAWYVRKCEAAIKDTPTSQTKEPCSGAATKSIPLQSTGRTLRLCAYHYDQLMKLKPSQETVKR